MPENTFSMKWNELSEIMKRLKPIVSQGDTIPASRGLHFQVRTSGVLLVTTLDGYRQGSILTGCVNKPEQDISFIVEPFDIPKAPKGIPGIVVITVTDKQAVFRFKHETGTETKEIRLIEAEPFDIAKAIPKKEPTAQFLVNPYYMIDAIKATMLNKKVHDPIVLNFYGPLDPLVITCKDVPNGTVHEAMVLPVRNRGQAETSVNIINRVIQTAEVKHLD